MSEDYFDWLSSARFGWIPDLPDARDRKLGLTFPAESLPAKVDLRAQCPPVYQQGALGSCTANAIAGAIESERMRQKLSIFTPSRLMIYYDERAMEGTISSDSGAMIRDGIKSVNVQGACPEDLWPYDIAKFTDKPPASAYGAALKDRALQYARVDQTVLAMRSCLAAGFPFVGGVSVYQSFMDATDGDIPVPGAAERLLGGHAIMFVGYDNRTERFIFRNSWGAAWGQGGYGTIPYGYLSSPDLAADFWNIQLVSQ